MWQPGLALQSLRQDHHTPGSQPPGLSLWLCTGNRPAGDRLEKASGSRRLSSSGASVRAFLRMWTLAQKQILSSPHSGALLPCMGPLHGSGSTLGSAQVFPPRSGRKETPPWQCSTREESPLCHSSVPEASVSLSPGPAAATSAGLEESTQVQTEKGVLSADGNSQCHPAAGPGGLCQLSPGLPAQ